MIEYHGSKFRYLSSHIEYDDWGFKVEKKDFIPTKSYMMYLKEKEKEKEKLEYIKLKHSLEYQYKTYGEVDEFDYQRFLSITNNSAMVGTR